MIMISGTMRVMIMMLIVIAINTGGTDALKGCLTPLICS